MLCQLCYEEHYYCQLAGVFMPPSWKLAASTAMHTTAFATTLQTRKLAACNHIKLTA